MYGLLDKYYPLPRLVLHRKKYLKNETRRVYFLRFHGISEKELELSQCGKFINVGCETKWYDVAMCDLIS